MDPAHPYFEFLGVLASSGQLSPREETELREHLADCEACRSRFLNALEVSAGLFFAQAWTAPKHAVPAGMEERFVARAIQSRIPLRRGETRRSSRPLLQFAGLAAAACLAVMLTADGFRRELISPPAGRADSVSKISEFQRRQPSVQTTRTELSGSPTPRRVRKTLRAHRLSESPATLTSHESGAGGASGASEALLAAGDASGASLVEAALRNPPRIVMRGAGFLREANSPSTSIGLWPWSGEMASNSPKFVYTASVSEWISLNSSGRGGQGELKFHAPRLYPALKATD